MRRVEQHMLLNNTNTTTNNTKGSTKSFKSSSGSNKDIISVDSISDLQLLDDDLDAAALQSIVNDSRDTETTVSMNGSNQSSNNNNTMSADSLDTSTNNNTGYGRALDSTAYDTLPDALADLQVNPSDITKVHEHYIGRGGFAKVYKVNYNHHGTLRTCAAKVTTVMMYSVHFLC
jgi:hypothetical protein